MAAEDILNDYPELRPYVLSNVQRTGVSIDAGAYGSVEEVAVPGAICAAKKIHEFFLDHSQFPEVGIGQVGAQFVRECQLMSTLRHPNIVQFLGIWFLPGSRIPALVMERLLTNLHNLLDPKIDPPPLLDAPKLFFPLSIKCKILHNVASGLAYLHDHSPPIIHCDLSARNILLDSGMVAKIADLGNACIVPRTRVAATMTWIPGASVYMPLEVLVLEDSAKYIDENIDIFSFGVITIFTLTQTFPCYILAPVYVKDDYLLGRTEIERRDRYMRMIYSQLRMKHPLLLMIEGCLDFRQKRPRIHEVLHLLEEAKAEEEIHISKLDLVQARLTRNQVSSYMLLQMINF